MTRQKLADAADVLDDVADDTDGSVADGLRDQAEQLRNLADRAQGPDHGRLDRHMHTLSNLADDAGGDAAEEIRRARTLVREYRETVEGV